MHRHFTGRSHSGVRREIEFLELNFAHLSWNRRKFRTKPSVVRDGNGAGQFQQVQEAGFARFVRIVPCNNCRGKERSLTIRARNAKAGPCTKNSQDLRSSSPPELNPETT